MAVKKRGRPKKQVHKVNLRITVDPVLLKKARGFFGKRNLSKNIESFFAISVGKLPQ